MSDRASVLHDRPVVRDARRMPLRAAAFFMFMSAMLPAAASAQPAEDKIRDVPQAAVNALGGTDFAFSITYNWRDDWWLAVQPAAKARGRPDSEALPAHAEKVAEIQIWKYEANSHCYTVIVNGKANDVCPTH